MAKKNGTLFGRQLTGKVLAPKFVTVTPNHEEVRHVVLRFRSPFDEDVAKDLGEAANAALAGLNSGMKSARFDPPKGAYHVTVEGTGEGAEPVTFKGAEVKRAVASIAEPSKSNPEPEPQVVLTWEAAWDDASLVALAHLINQAGLLSVALTQPSLLDGE